MYDLGELQIMYMAANWGYNSLNSQCKNSKLFIIKNACFVHVYKDLMTWSICIDSTVIHIVQVIKSLYTRTKIINQ